MAKDQVRRAEGAPDRKLAGDKIFEVAADLFYRKGVRAVGVEAIVKQAGVAKISLYRNFASKDDLVVAYLQDRNAAFWHHWDEAFAPYKADPHAQLHAIMTYLAHRTTQPGYRGCPFINYCAEFPEPEHPGRKVAEANKREMRRRFVTIAEALGARHPKQLRMVCCCWSKALMPSARPWAAKRARVTRCRGPPRRWSRQNWEPRQAETSKTVGRPGFAPTTWR